MRHQRPACCRLCWPIIPSAAALTPIQQWKPEESATDRLWWMPANSGKSRTQPHPDRNGSVPFLAFVLLPGAWRRRNGCPSQLSQILTEEVTA